MYELPENIAALSIEDLDSHIDQALDAFRALNISEASSDEDIDTAEAIKASLETLRAQKASAVEAAAARAQRIAALAESVEVAASDPEPEAEPTPDPEAEPAAPEAAPAEAAVPVAAAVEVVTPDEVITPTQEVQPVAASASQSPVARAAAAAPEVIVPAAPRASLIAAADVPGFANGAPLEGLRAAATAVLARTKGLPRTNLATAQGGVRQRYGAALIRKDVPADLVQSTDGGGDLDLIWHASDASRLPGGSLVAAGGWCAPSETLYDLCQFETIEGIIDMPETQVTRGGLRFTSGPDFSDIYAACGFFQTEADAIAGECKDCCMVDCPPFDEIRLDAIGLCVKSPLLTEAAYPELVQRFIEGALVAHAHKVNKYLIDSIALAAGTPVVAADTGSFSKSLAAIELSALGIRYRYRMSQTATIEVILPFWAKIALRIDLAFQNNRNPVSITDAEIDSWFTSRNLSVQWVYDYQSPVVNGCAVDLPNSVTALMYPAGTWVKGSLDVISLDAVYDSPNLEANQYTALFVEEGILAVQKCTHTCAITVPVCISGKGVLEDLDLCLVAPGDTTPPT